jgi:hypothetical protein
MAGLADTAWQRAMIASLWVYLFGIVPTLVQDEKYGCTRFFIEQTRVGWA